MPWKDIATLGAKEKIVWACVLRRAVFDYVLYRGSGKHKLAWKRASQFIFEGVREEEDGLTFDEICCLFKWEPDYIRRLAKTLTRSDVRRIETTKLREIFDVDPEPESRKLTARSLVSDVCRSYKSLFQGVVESRIRVQRSNPYDALEAVESRIHVQKTRVFASA